MAFPEGFKAMISPVLILTFAWTLSNMTSLLGAREYVSAIFAGSASHMTAMLPAIVFLVAIFLAFSTGTSWGTFGILLPIIAGIKPAVGAIGDHRIRLSGRCSLRRSLFSDFRYYHYVLSRRAV